MTLFVEIGGTPYKISDNLEKCCHCEEGELAVFASPTKQSDFKDVTDCHLSIICRLLQIAVLPAGWLKAPSTGEHGGYRTKIVQVTPQ